MSAGRVARSSLRQSAWAPAIIFSVLLVLAMTELAAASGLMVWDLRQGFSLLQAAKARYYDLRRAWRPPTFYGQFDPVSQVRHLPGRTYGQLTVNRHGFIGNGHDDPALTAYPEKPEGFYRIIMLGGSSMAGLGVSDNRQTIAAQLESLLNARPPDAGLRYQVLNFGAAGGYTGAETTRFFMRLAHVQPDLVICLDGFNDAWNALLEPHRVGLPHSVANWSDYSYLYFETLNGYRRPGTAPPPKLFTYTMTLINRVLTAVVKAEGASLAFYEQYPWYPVSGMLQAQDPTLSQVLRTNLGALAAYMTMEGRPGLLAYLQPHAHEGKSLTAEEQTRLREWHERYATAFGEAFAWEPYRAVMLPAFARYAQVYAELARRYDGVPNVRFVDLRDLFAGVPAEVYVDNIHYTAEGNRLLAERMCEDLAGMGRKRR
jgi:lysophospholipase L1-like esterase